MNKYAIIDGQARRTDRIILDNIQRYTDLRRAMQELIDNPTDQDIATEIDIEFQRISMGLEELGNSISTLAKILVSEDGLIDEIDGMEDENGVRLQ